MGSRTAAATSVTPAVPTFALPTKERNMSTLSGEGRLISSLDLYNRLVSSVEESFSAATSGMLTLVCDIIESICQFRHADQTSLGKRHFFDRMTALPMQCLFQT